MFLTTVYWSCIYIQEGTNALLLSIFRKQPQVIRALMGRHPNVDLVDEVYTLVSYSIYYECMLLVLSLFPGHFCCVREREMLNVNVMGTACMGMRLVCSV